MPAWVDIAVKEYSKRLPAQLGFTLKSVALQKRTKHADTAALKHREGEQLLAHTQPSHQVIALDVTGKAWDTPALAEQLQQWQLNGQDIDLLVGGPDGLSDACLSRADTTWSLSRLTLPHPLVRVILVEQLYRAWSILANHPYHR